MDYLTFNGLFRDWIWINTGENILHCLILFGFGDIAYVEICDGFAGFQSFGGGYNGLDELLSFISVDPLCDFFEIIDCFEGVGQDLQHSFQGILWLVAIRCA